MSPAVSRRGPARRCRARTMGAMTSFWISWGWVGLALGATLLCLVLGLCQGLIAGSVHAVLYVFVHAYPRSPKFSVRWLEFDPSWLVIRALATVGLLVITGTPATLAGSGAPSGEPRRHGAIRSVR